MDRYAIRLAELVSSADAAYRRARSEVYDTLPVGARVDIEALSPSQRDAFEDLIIAEAELAHFRHSHVEPERTNQQSVSILHAV